MKNIYQFKVKTIDQKEEELSRYQGSVLLVVNVASECVFTGQYEGLEKLYKKYRDQKFYVLGFPCNQFRNQEPKSDQEIKSFCQVRFGVSFPLYAKVDVNGPTADPLFKFISKEKPGILGSSSIKWNFTKFLIDRKGEVIKRFAPTDSPAALEADIEKLLK